MMISLARILFLSVVGFAVLLIAQSSLAAGIYDNEQPAATGACVGTSGTTGNNVHECKNSGLVPGGGTLAIAIDDAGEACANSCSPGTCQTTQEYSSTTPSCSGFPDSEYDRYNVGYQIFACATGQEVNTYDSSTCLPTPDPAYDEGDGNECGTSSGYTAVFGQCEPIASEDECHSGGWIYSESGSASGSGYCTFDGGNPYDSSDPFDPVIDDVPEECDTGYCSWPSDEESCNSVGGSFGQINGVDACVSDGAYCATNPNDPLCTGESTYTCSDNTVVSSISECSVDTTDTSTSDTTVTDNGDGTTTTTSQTQTCDSANNCVTTTITETCDSVGNCSSSTVIEGTTSEGAGICDPTSPDYLECLTEDVEFSDYEYVDNLEQELIDANDEFATVVEDIRNEASSLFSVNLATNNSCPANAVSIYGKSIDFSLCRFSGTLALIGIAIFVASGVASVFIILGSK